MGEKEDRRVKNNCKVLTMNTYREKMKTGHWQEVGGHWKGDDDSRFGYMSTW